MRINNNLMAMNTHRQLGLGNTASSKSMEKLSSGYRINRAGDDAAGLAISEKMRGQIRGLNQASRNAQDGISLIQTAEGALNETHAILQRMRELAVQSATDTNTNTDRAEIQKEVDQLAQEITRIADSTQFNTMNLLDGTYTAKEFHIGANSDQSTSITVSDMRSAALNVNRTVYTATDVTGTTGVQVTSQSGKALTIEFAALSTDVSNPEVANTTAVYDEVNGKITVTLAQEAGNGTTAGASAATNETVRAALDSVASAAGITVSTTADFAAAAATPITPTGTVAVSTTVDTVATAASTQGINVSTQDFANTAITTVNNALETVSAERSKLGAMQNRLEHTIKNLDTSSENLQASESRIRDVDMAKEMMEFTKNNILTQAAQAMLAQANQAPQGVLQLLR